MSTKWNGLDIEIVRILNLRKCLFVLVYDWRSDKLNRLLVERLNVECKSFHIVKLFVAARDPKNLFTFQVKQFVQNTRDRLLIFQRRQSYLLAFVRPSYHYLIVHLDFVWIFLSLQVILIFYFTSIIMPFTNYNRLTKLLFLIYKQTQRSHFNLWNVFALRYR